MATGVLSVLDISCEQGEHTITNALTPVRGIKNMCVRIPDKQVHVDYDETQVRIDQMKEVLQEEDYPLKSVA